jgi:RNA polymerase sigma-70 factor, ECF subfamily
MFDKNAWEKASDSLDSAHRPLIQKAKKGDETAFGQLYEFYFEKIYKFIYYRVNHKEVAEDLSEDVFIKAWAKIGTVSEDSFGGWLYSIAKNRIIDHYRQAKTTVDLLDVENILEADGNIVDDTNLLIEQKLFMVLLKKLSPEQQIVIKLKFIEDMDNGEIAELISKSEGSIRVIQHRAIQKLQTLFDEQIQLKLKKGNE